MTLEDDLRRIVRAELVTVLRAELAAALDRPERIACTIPEAAESLGVGEDLVAQAVKAGDLPLVPIGRRRHVIPVEALRHFAMSDARPRLQIAGSPDLPPGDPAAPAGASAVRDRRGGRTTAPGRRTA